MVNSANCRIFGQLYNEHSRISELFSVAAPETSLAMDELPILTRSFPILTCSRLLWCILIVQEMDTVLTNLYRFVDTTIMVVSSNFSV